MRLLPTIIAVVLLAGCSNGPAPPKPAPLPPPPVVEKDDADHPVVKEARVETDAILKDLLAGKTGNDTGLAHLAGKLKGYNSWSIEKQELRPGDPTAVLFTGTLKAPANEAGFQASMVKQMSGKWAIGRFSGPNPK